MQTLFGTRLARHARDAGSAPAVVLRGGEIGYPGLLRQVERCAAWLVAQGCRPSETVGVTVADELAHLVVSLGLLHLGVPQVCLPAHEPGTARRDLAGRLGLARVVVADPGHALPEVRAALLPPDLLDGTAGAEVQEALEPDPDAPAIYFASSGTTGAPKIFALSQRALARRSEHMLAAEGIVSGCRAFTPIHVGEFPSKSKRLNCVYQGLTSVFGARSSFAPAAIRQLCADLAVTRLELNLLQLAGLLAKAPEGLRLPEQTIAFVSGARVPARVREAFAARFGCGLFVHYGAREFGRIATTFPRGEADAPEAVGTPHPWVELEIVDGDGRVLPAGEVGEVRVRAEGMIHEYYRDPEATARHFRAGWFYPGDMGALTAGGALCVHGRADDMMNLNGIKIFPAEIERVLEEHPAVRAAAAFARPSAHHGDIPVAAVELYDSAEVSVEELTAYARGRLGVRGPRRIVVVEALPRSPAGKVLKQGLLALVVPDG